MADVVVKPIKMAIIRNPKKGYIRTPSPEEVKKYEVEKTFCICGNYMLDFKI